MPFANQAQQKFALVTAQEAEQSHWLERDDVADWSAFLVPCPRPTRDYTDLEWARNVVERWRRDIASDRDRETRCREQLAKWQAAKEQP